MRLRKLLLPALTVFAMFLSAIACNPERAVTKEPAPTERPVVTQEPAVTPLPVATQQPDAKPERLVTKKVVVSRSTEEHQTGIPPCMAGAFAYKWGNGGDAVGWSRAGNEIVFAMGPKVYAVGADGVGLRLVTDASAKVTSLQLPAPTTSFDVSPSGTEIVYSTCEPMKGWESEARDLFSYEHELALASLDGGQVRRLTENKHFDNHPSWSPDGTRTAFISSGETPGLIQVRDEVHLYSMAVDGTGVRRIATGPLVHHPPQWLPDGSRIAYAKFEADRPLADPAIYVVGAGGGEETRLTDAVSGPSWSPDGTRIAYAKADGDDVALYTIAADGSDARRLAAIDGWQHQLRYEGFDPARAWIRKVSWSPDGSRILFLARWGDVFAIHIVGADGSGLARIAVGLSIPDDIGDAAWSPDGTRIAISGRGREPIALVTVAAEGTGPRVLVRRQEDGELVGLLVGLGVARGNLSADVAACGEGVAVPDPEANPGLVEDCETLMEVQNALAGSRGLDWLVERNIGGWEGIVLGGGPLRVQEIELRSRGLRSEIPSELSRLPELRVLDISRNGLTGGIPPELGELKNLERLDVSQNRLSGEIPPELSGLIKLTYLSMGLNDLSGEVPVELGELSGLTVLSLGGNDLDGEIPTELGRLTRLEELSLRGNRLTGEIPAELGQLTELRNLHLADNELTGTIPRELADLPELQLLRLSGNQLTGCVPAGLREIGDTDAPILGLPDCE